MTSSTPAPSPQTRLIIRDIDVENFKSYAGCHRIGPFHKTFSCVIGPNGSGKSNVIDAMLFVFGKSAKKIRLEKLSELIHNSAAYSDLSYAAVTVNFVEVRETPEDAADPTQLLYIPGTELSIKREVHRNNVSQYFINGMRTTQKEVVQTLTDKGVDLSHNRFLILQGEVEQISLMKPKAEKEGEEGLLEYLDDLIGTNQFVGLISEAAAAFEKAQEERLNLLDDVRRAEADRNALEAAKLTAMDYVTRENQLKSLMTIMCQLKMAETEAKLVEPRKRLEELDERRKALDVEEQGHQNALKDLKDKEQKRKAALDTAQQQHRGMSSRKASLDQDLERERTGLEEFEKTRKRESDRKKKLRDEIAQCDVQLHAAETDSAVREQRRVEAAALVEELQPQFDLAQEQLVTKQQPVRLQLEAKRKTLQPFAHRANKARVQREAAADRVTREVQRREAMQTELQKAKSESARLAQAADDCASMLAKLEHDDTRPRLEALREQLKKQVSHKMQLSQNIEEVKGTFREGTAEDRMTDFLLSQRDLEGFYGTLRQLGRIDDAYDVAAGMASNHWGHLVVEDRETASLVLKRLRDANKGRATIIVLKEVSKRLSDRVDRKFTSPNPQAVRLFDLIKPIHPKFLPAFYNAVQDTLVVDGLTLARELVFHSGSGQRHRVVTKRGDLVEPNGTMTGGGQPKPAKLKAARAPQDQTQVRETLTRLQEELRNAVEQENQTREQLSQLEDAARGSDRGLDRIRKLKAERNEALAGAARFLQDVQRLDSQLEASRDEHAKLVNHLRREEQHALDELTTAEESERTYKRDVEMLELELQSMGGDAFVDLKKRLEEAKKRLETDENALRESKKQLQKLKTSKERKEKDLAEVQQADNPTVQEETIAAHKAEIARLLTAIDEASKECIKSQKVVTEAEQQMESIKEALSEADQSLRNVSRARDDIARDKKDIEGSIQQELGLLTKLTGKITDNEAHVRSNIREYGPETFEPARKMATVVVEESTEGGKKKKNKLGKKNGDDDDDAEDDDDKSAIDDKRGNRNGRNAQVKKARPAKRERSDDEEEEEDDEEAASSDDEDDDDETVADRRLGSQTHRTQQTLLGQGGHAVRIESLRELTDDEIESIVLKVPEEQLHEQYDYQHISHLCKSLFEELKRIETTIDLKSVGRWKEKDSIYREQKAKYDAALQQLSLTEASLQELKLKRKAVFLDCFTVIQKQVKQMYQLLTHGGDCEMELVDTQDPFEGVNYLVRPPKKSWKQVGNLSGGEKTLASLALVFALHHVRPTPVYVMDEIDAALDFKNVSIVANYVLRQATGAQFIIISLRNNMFELAHQLVGICKVKDVTRSLVLNPHAMQNLITEMILNMRKRPRAVTN